MWRLLINFYYSRRKWRSRCIKTTLSLNVFFINIYVFDVFFVSNTLVVFHTLLVVVWVFLLLLCVFFVCFVNIIIFYLLLLFQGRMEMFYLTTHAPHFILWLYGIRHMAKDIAREETCCHHMGYSFWLAARFLLYAPSHRQNNTYHSL